MTTQDGSAEPRRFPQLLALMQGTAEPTACLGFVDLLGTTAAFGEFIKNNGNNQAALTRLMTSFASSLANVAKEDKGLQVIQASDGAFLVGSADAVLRGVVKTMLYAPFFFFDTKSMGFIPMRAAIADGLVRVEQNEKELAQLGNLFTYPYWGPAFVKTHMMEKTKTCTGVRVFVTESVAGKLHADSRKVISPAEIATVSVEGHGEEKYFQANWLALVQDLTNEVLAEFGIDPSEDEYGIKQLARICLIGQQWAGSEEKYTKMFGESIVELKGSLEKHI